VSLYPASHGIETQRVNVAYRFVEFAAVLYLRWCSGS
jgi:hypothetical protein